MIDIFLAHPEMLHKCIGSATKVVGINVMDPLRYGTSHYYYVA